MTFVLKLPACLWYQTICSLSTERGCCVDLDVVENKEKPRTKKQSWPVKVLISYCKKWWLFNWKKWFGTYVSAVDSVTTPCFLAGMQLCDLDLHCDLSQGQIIAQSHNEWALVVPAVFLFFLQSPVQAGRQIRIAKFFFIISQSVCLSLCLSQFECHLSGFQKMPQM